MSIRAVYDAMIFFQWATLPPDQPNRQHATVTALLDGTVRFCLSPDLLAEVAALLTRPKLQARYKTLTAQHVAGVLNRARAYADFFDQVPRRFSLPGHAKDDHLFDLAIEADAQYLVTWESRLLKLQSVQTPQAKQLAELAPNLLIVNPSDFAADLNRRKV